MPFLHTDKILKYRHIDRFSSKIDGLHLLVDKFTYFVIFVTEWNNFCTFASGSK